MIKKTNQLHKAFSLVELSIVILIIGVLVAAVGQGLDLLQDARLNAARTLTQSSRVNSIKNLVVWYEPTSEKSFDSAEAVDQALVSKWYDTNPRTVAADKANFSASGTNRPKYLEKCINSLPCLDFDGTDDYMVSPSLGGTSGGGLSVFAVVNLDEIASSDAKTYLVLATTGAAGSTFAIKAYGAFTTQFQFQQTNPDYPVWNRGVRKEVNYLVEGIIYTNTAYLWANKVAANISQGSAQPTFVAFNTLNVGGTNGGNNFFNGKIAELIIFDRALTDKEKISVEDYLDKKWQLF